jgi:hypothetical protein
LSKSPKATKPSKGLLIADIRALAEKHGEISRDFYRKNNSIVPTKDAWSGEFSSFPEFKKAAGLIDKTAVKPEELTAEHRVKIIREKEVTKREQRKEDFKILLQENEELQRKLDVLTSLNETTPQTFHIQPYEPSDESESTAVLVCSDWHSEEEVDPRKVNGVNEYNLDIFSDRAMKLFQRAGRMWYIGNKDTRIRSMIVGFLGDFISGNIHDDIIENNLSGMNEAILNAHEKLAGGLRYLLDNTDVEEFIVVCHSGNHGRLTKEQRIATEAQNSIEYTMYNYLRREFANEPRVRFLISESYLSHVVLYDAYTIRFHHGHNIRYSGGVGGIYIPVNKKINEWNKSRIPGEDGILIPPVALDVFGHFHQYIDAGNFVCNGSLIGYNPFAQAIGASVEPPQQAFFLINKRWKAKTMATPIFVTE